MGQEEKEQEQEQCSTAYCNLQTELILSFIHLKQDNYKKKTVPRRCFQILTQNFLEIIKTNLFDILTKSRMFSQNSRMQKMAKPNPKNCYFKKTMTRLN